MLKRFIKKRFLGKARYQRLFRYLFTLSLEGLNIGTGGRNMAETGETNLLSKCLAHTKQPIVFDVGAQGGEWIRETKRLTHDTARIYAFEPCTRDFTLLEQTHPPQVQIFKLALGAETGTRLLRYPENKRGLSSFYTEHPSHTKTEEVSVETLDRFCDTHNIDRIDFLKLDIEGAELDCFKGAQEILKKTNHIQFEFGIPNRDARVYFRDIFTLLSPDFTLYRILQDGIEEIETPDKINELLYTTNFYARKKEKLRPRS